MPTQDDKGEFRKSVLSALEKLQTSVSAMDERIKKVEGFIDAAKDESGEDDEDY